MVLVNILGGEKIGVFAPGVEMNYVNLRGVKSGVFPLVEKLVDSVENSILSTQKALPKPPEIIPEISQFSAT